MALEEAKQIYPKEELNLWEENQNILKDLENELQNIAIKEEEKAYTEKINFDGFYPYYTQQSLKILFIGKEALNINGQDYIQTMYEGILANDTRGQGKYTVNQDKFHARMLYLTYGLNNENCSYNSMPYASWIGQNNFSKKKGISYALINYSKFDNPSETSFVSDIKRMKKYRKMISKCTKNYYQKQISLLDPDLIIKMNLSDTFGSNLFETSPIKWEQSTNENIAIGNIEIDNKKYLLIETWHFSAGKSFNNCYYEPIKKIVENKTIKHIYK